MRRSLLGMSLGLLATVAPGVPAAGQSWLPSWSKLTRQKTAPPASATMPPAPASPYGPSPYGPSTYSPSPYGPSASSPSPYGQWPAASPYGQHVAGTAQPGPGTAPFATGMTSPAASFVQPTVGANQPAGGPVLMMPGSTSPAGFQGAGVADTMPPQVDLGMPARYAPQGGAIPTPVPNSAPILTSAPPAPMMTAAVPPAANYGAPTMNYGAAPTVPRYMPSGAPGAMSSPATNMMPPMPMTGPGVSSSPGWSSAGGLPGYGGARSGVNYGSFGAPQAEGPATFGPGGEYLGPSYAGPNYAGPSYAGAGSAGPCVSPYEAYPPYVGSPGTISSCAPPRHCYDDFTAFYNYSAFKGPLDLDGLNGNFGNRVGVFGALPVYAPLGIAAQLGGSYGWYDWKGTAFTGVEERTQNFITAGLFQRTSFGLNYGAAYDWLLDDYYSDFHFEQVRGAVSYSLSPSNEIGVWAAMPTRKDSATIGTPPVNNTFEPVLQANLYWRKVWCGNATTNTFLGWCEEPNDFSYGTTAQFALNGYMAVNGGFQYIWPGSGSNTGREEEIWTVSFGLVFYPGSAMSSATSAFRPLLAMPDNGNFAIRRH